MPIACFWYFTWFLLLFFPYFWPRNRSFINCIMLEQMQDTPLFTYYQCKPEYLCSSATRECSVSNELLQTFGIFHTALKTSASKHAVSLHSTNGSMCFFILFCFQWDNFNTANSTKKNSAASIEVRSLFSIAFHWSLHNGNNAHNLLSAKKLVFKVYLIEKLSAAWASFSKQPNNTQKQQQQNLNHETKITTEIEMNFCKNYYYESILIIKHTFSAANVNT